MDKATEALVNVTNCEPAVDDDGGYCSVCDSPEGSQHVTVYDEGAGETMEEMATESLVKHTTDCAWKLTLDFVVAAVRK